MFLKIYRVVNILITPILILLLFIRVIRKKEDSLRVKERFGITKKRRPSKQIIWIHAASVGETISILPFLYLFKDNPKYFIIFTSGTLTSARLLRSKLPKNSVHQYAPIENYFAIKNFLSHWKPHLSIFVESEFWPCILNETSKVSKIISLNTRISDTSFKRWKANKKIFKEIASLFALFMPQSETNYKRLKTLGIKQLHYVGNLKYTVPTLTTNTKVLASLKDTINGRKVVLFASTHQGEESIILDIYKQLHLKYSNILFIIVPRHPHRSSSINNLIKKHGYKTAIRSKKRTIKDETNFYIADTIGELGTMFRISPISVICGSFVKVGGHNPIEAAKLKSTVIMGPYTSNFKEICAEFKKNKAAIFVKNKKECVKAIQSLLNSPSTQKKYIFNALTFINTKNSILKDTLRKVKEYLK